MKNHINQVPKPPKDLKGEAKLKYVYEQLNLQQSVKKLMSELANK